MKKQKKPTTKQILSLLVREISLLNDRILKLEALTYDNDDDDDNELVVFELEDRDQDLVYYG